jgi:DivIVA domain-containing protein
MPPLRLPAHHLRMEHDDPEKLIAEMERRLADAHPVGDARTSHGTTVSGGLTSEDVRNVAFSKPPIGKRGYNEDEVDAFLDMLLTHVAARPGAFPAPPQDAVAPPPARRSRSKHERPQSRYRRITDNVLSIVEWFTDPGPNGGA